MKPGQISLLAVLVVAALVGSMTALGPNASAVTPVQVSIVNYAFQSPSITIVIGVNNTVVWTNDGTVSHTVTQDGSLFASGAISPGNNFQFTFSSPGDYFYHCSIHPTMTAVVHVLTQHSGTTTTGSSSTSTMGGGIPEFPLQAVAISVLIVTILSSYLLLRRQPAGLGAPRQS